MDLKIKYNKDRSRIQVVLTVKPARYIHESRVYNTAYIVKELGKKGVSVEKGDCTIPTKVFNYAGLEKCTGTWTFSLARILAKEMWDAMTPHNSLPAASKSQGPGKSAATLFTAAKRGKSVKTKSKKAVRRPTVPRKKTTTARSTNRKTTKKV
mgnify:CR=1 FL=1